MLAGRWSRAGSCWALPVFCVHTAPSAGMSLPGTWSSGTKPPRCPAGVGLFVPACKEGQGDPGKVDVAAGTGRWISPRAWAAAGCWQCPGRQKRGSREAKGGQDTWVLPEVPGLVRLPPGSPAGPTSRAGPTTRIGSAQCTRPNHLHLLPGRRWGPGCVSLIRGPLPVPAAPGGVLLLPSVSPQREACDGGRDPPPQPAR